MMTVHLAIEGVLGKSSYVPIEKAEVQVDHSEWDKASAEAVSKFAAMRKLRHGDFRTTDDHKIVAQAMAWGYEEAWINGEGYVVFVGQETPNDRPDPVYAYWIPEKERSRMLESRMPYPTKKAMRLVDACVLLMKDEGVASAETIDVFLKAYGRSLSVLNDLLMATVGERDVIGRYADKLEACGLIEKGKSNVREGEEEVESVEVVEVPETENGEEENE